MRTTFVPSAMADRLMAAIAEAAATEPTLG